MELVADVWPVADQLTGLVQRFFMRAYALEVDDATISRTLTTLAPTDFRMARVFQVPRQFEYVTSAGTLEGCVTLGDFHEYQLSILESAMRALEADYPRLQGIAMSDGEPVGISLLTRFPAEPYLVVTTLIETPDGQLLPQLKPQGVS
ncbi:hypothetical protein BH11VER1_BH11VER1_01930 [soil metagenome]